MKIASDLKSQLYRKINPVTSYPITLDEVKNHLNLTITTSEQDDSINLMISAVTEYAECYTSTDFLKKDYVTNRDYFESQFLIERHKLNSVSLVEYLNCSNVWTSIDAGTYYITDNQGFDYVALDCYKCWPMDYSCADSSIRIHFNSGLHNDASEVDGMTKIALLNHVAELFYNRGDCGCTAESCIPCTTLEFYRKKKVSF